MTKILGALLFMLSAFLWGADRAEREKEKTETVLCSAEFVRFVKEEIESFRRPLSGIFSAFENERLERYGFCNALKERGANAAVAKIKTKLPKDAYNIMLVFAKELGGGYESGQISLCDRTYQKLSEIGERENLSLSGRVRMYRLLPLLFSASVIILLI